MPKFYSPLNNLKIASPCSADWEGMYGDERKRFCGECKLNVYNLSGMTRKEAEALLENSEGRLCVRYYQRADGTVLTADCPVGWAKVRQRLSAAATAAFSLIVSLVSGGLFVSFLNRPAEVRMGAIPVSTPEPLMGDVAGPPRMPLMGAVAVRPREPKRESPESTSGSTPDARSRSKSPKPGSESEEMRRRVSRAAGLEDDTSL
jgi:hypothetical protein